jgi:ABC-2 type transport system ATP-binding protein
MNEPASPPTPVVHVGNLRKSYGDVHALAGVSFDVEAGEFFGIVGPNGAGKSTLIEIMEGMRRADSGTVRVLGLSPWPRNRALLPRVGVQRQASAFFARLTAGEHITTVAALYGVGRKQAYLSLDAVGLGEKRDARVDTLSGGQRQRLAIASALTHRPALLFLDEPTGALDPQARRSLWEVLHAIKAEGNTIVYTTHHLNEAEALCDRVAILDQGTMVALDTPASLVTGLGAPTRIRIPDQLITLDAARRICGADDATTGSGSVIISTRSAGRVLVALNDVISLDGIRTSTATLEDVFLELTGKEHAE